MKNEDGVAAVVALMLLLAVIVTFLSLYATTYQPALKQQAEIGQITGVKEAFMRFDSDIGHVMANRESAGYSEMIVLGGGDIIISPEKTSGTVSVEDTGELFRVSGTNAGSGTVVQSSNSSVVWFEPAYSFWEKQGYSWQFGYINVTRGSRATPLSYYTMGDVAEDHVPGYAGKILDLSDTAYADDHAYLDDLVVTSVTILPGSALGEEQHEASGNGACMLRINSSVSTVTLDDATLLSVTIADSPFRTSLADRSAIRMNDLVTRYPSSMLGYTSSSDATTDTRTLAIPVNPSHPVTLIIRTVTIAVYVR